MANPERGKIPSEQAPGTRPGQAGHNQSMSEAPPARPATYSERLWPTPWLYAALLLIVPAVTLVVTPMNQAIALPLAIVLYALVAGWFTLVSPKITLENGVLTAGRASIPAELLGAAETLDADELRSAIGPGLDARAHLLVRGYIHLGVRVEVTDPEDPTPYWVITTRRPRTLVAAIEAARLAG